MALPLPDPMLARSGAIPTGRGWTFGPKLDGFRCMVCTHGGFRARSRRGWDMTHLLPEFRRSLPEGVQLDGELVPLDEAGRPDFHRLSSRMLHGRGGIAVTLFAFDVLAVEGHATTMQPYSEQERDHHAEHVRGTCSNGRRLRTRCGIGLRLVTAACCASAARRVDISC